MVRSCGLGFGFRLQLGFKVRVTVSSCYIMLILSPGGPELKSYMYVRVDREMHFLLLIFLGLRRIVFGP